MLRHRRFAVLSLLRFATPLIWDFVLPDSPDLISKDGRRFAPPPAARKVWRDGSSFRSWSTPIRRTVSA
jgi:hypothetical protein